MNLTSEDYLFDKLANRLHGVVFDKKNNKWHHCENPKIGYTYLEMKNWVEETIDNKDGHPSLREENFEEWKARKNDENTPDN